MISDRDPRRWQERADARLINEDPAAMSNLPREFVNKQVYHNSPVYGPYSMKNGGEMMESFFAIVKDKK